MSHSYEIKKEIWSSLAPIYLGPELPLKSDRTEENIVKFVVVGRSHIYSFSVYGPSLCISRHYSMTSSDETRCDELSCRTWLFVSFRALLVERPTTNHDLGSGTRLRSHMFRTEVSMVFSLGKHT